MRGVIGLAAVAATLGAGAVASSAATSRVSVQPRTIGPRTAVSLRFRVPDATGPRLSDSVQVLGPAGRRCSATRVAAFTAPRGGMVHVTMRPGGRWCTGRYHGTVLERRAATCRPVPGRVCPMYVIAPRTVARFTFRVTAR